MIEEGKEDTEEETGIEALHPHPKIVKGTRKARKSTDTEATVVTETEAIQETRNVTK